MKQILMKQIITYMNSIMHEIFKFRKVCITGAVHVVELNYFGDGQLKIKQSGGNVDLPSSPSTNMPGQPGRDMNGFLVMFLRNTFPGITNLKCVTNATLLDYIYKQILHLYIRFLKKYNIK